MITPFLQLIFDIQGIDMWKRLLCTAILAQAGFGAWAAGGNADSYPSRPIRLILGFAPGGADDYLARVIGSKLTERFGQAVIVDNRPGAAGTIAAEITARANPDGYTLMLGLNPALAASRSLYPKLGYDLLKDLSYISVVATGTQVLLAHPSVPAKSIAVLLAFSR
jgi:tripartite-type tricarboxylate transporter receptor subunit TctC